MPIGKNSISRVAGEPVAEPEVKTEAPTTQKPATKSTAAKTASSKSAASKSSAAKSTAAKSSTAKSTAKKPAAPKAETVERIETVAKSVIEAAKEAPKTEEVKAYVTITDELPTYLL